MTLRDIEGCFLRDFGIDISSNAGIDNNKKIGKGLDAVFKNWNGAKDLINIRRPNLDKIFKQAENASVAYSKDSNEGKYFTSIIPSYFYIKEDSRSYYNAMYNGMFWTVDEQDTTVIISKLQDKPESGQHIVDIYQTSVYDVNEQIIKSVSDIKASYSEYIRKITYSDSSNIRYKTIEIPENNFYDHIYSMTKDESKRMQDWENKHLRKFHKEDAKVYRGAISVSDFCVNIGTTSIGTYIECICSTCMERKTVEKKDYIFTVRELGD